MPTDPEQQRRQEREEMIRADIADMQRRLEQRQRDLDDVQGVARDILDPSFSPHTLTK